MDVLPTASHTDVDGHTASEMAPLPAGNESLDHATPPLAVWTIVPAAVLVPATWHSSTDGHATLFSSTAPVGSLSRAHTVPLVVLIATANVKLPLRPTAWQSLDDPHAIAWSDPTGAAGVDEAQVAPPLVECRTAALPTVELAPVPSHTEAVRQSTLKTEPTPAGTTSLVHEAPLLAVRTMAPAVYLLSSPTATHTDADEQLTPAR
jgi:hypothetical protein